MASMVALVAIEALDVGSATTMMLAGKGLQVLISGPREALDKKVIQEVHAQIGDVAFIIANVHDEIQVRRMVGSAVSKYGRLDVAVEQCSSSNQTKLNRRRDGAITPFAGTPPTQNQSRADLHRRPALRRAPCHQCGAYAYIGT